jgi:hypothetical protein
MVQTQTPRRKRTHTPVWDVLWSVRPRLKGFLLDTPAAAAAPVKRAAPRTAPAAAAAPVPPAKVAGTPPLQAQEKAQPAAWWVKQIGKDMALVPLKLLHLLLAGYEPQAQRPQIRYRRST